MQTQPGRKIAVIGSGVAGLSAAWLLSQRHDVTIFEKADRLGGHSHTIDVPVAGRKAAIDTGFIVYNPAAYPNLTALFDHLGVATQASEMSFGVSLDGGRLEYSGGTLAGLMAQPGNVLRPRFWSMLRDITRFYREAPQQLGVLERSGCTLGGFLEQHGFGAALAEDHLLPMSAAIWSAPEHAMRDYPAAAFVRFFINHGLLQIRGRPLWRTVTGGSRSYVNRIARSMRAAVRLNAGALTVERHRDHVDLVGAGTRESFDDVVIATHADHALGLLAAPSPQERAVLETFRYAPNLCVTHKDASSMPRRRAAWSSWNVTRCHPGSGGGVCVTYWMNRLQALDLPEDIFVTLNPSLIPRYSDILNTQIYEHPLFDARSLAAQKRLWSLQGCARTWFCGAYFGAGFHEDGLQAGLAVAEALGGVERPWRVAGQSDRIHITASPAPEPKVLAA